MRKSSLISTLVVGLPLFAFSGCAEQENDAPDPAVAEIAQHGSGTWTVFSSMPAMGETMALWGNYSVVDGVGQPVVYSMGQVAGAGDFPPCAWRAHRASGSTALTFAPSPFCPSSFSGTGTGSSVDLFFSGNYSSIFQTAVSSATYAARSTFAPNGDVGAAQRSDGSVDVFVRSGSTMKQLHRSPGGSYTEYAGFGPPTGRVFSEQRPGVIWATVGGVQKLTILTPTLTDLSVTRWNSSSSTFVSTAGVLATTPLSGIGIAQTGAIGVGDVFFYTYVDSSGNVGWGYSADAGVTWYPGGSIGAPPVGVGSSSVTSGYIAPTIVVGPGGFSDIHIFVVGTNKNIYTYSL